MGLLFGAVLLGERTVLTRTNGMGARLCSKIAFFYWALWKVKVPLCPWSLLIPIELD